MPMPERRSFDHVVDEGSFVASSDQLSSTDPLGWPGYVELLKETRGRSGIDDSVLAGAATIGGHQIEIGAFDFSFLGGSMGEVAGERVARAIERAVQRGVPFVLRAATGGARMQEGMRALIQMPKVVVARALLSDAHLPFFSVLGDPTTGGVLASVASIADYTIAEAGATIGFAGPRVVETVTGTRPSATSHTAVSALGNGLVDAVVEPGEVRSVLTRALEALASDLPGPAATPERATAKEPDPWDAVRSARAIERASAVDLAHSIATNQLELRGDRAGVDDPSLVASIGRVAGRRVMLLALDRTRLLGVGAFRKARRCLGIAARLSLPVVCLVDTAGADPSESSESTGIAWESATTLEAMLALPVPILAVVTGEGGSGGALAFAVGDRVVIYEHAIFSVIGPESAASILWRDPAKAPDAARALKLTAHQLMALGIADAVIPEPPVAGSLIDVVAYHLDAMSSDQDRIAMRRARWRTGHV